VPDKDSPFNTERSAQNAAEDPSDDAKLAADAAAADAEVAKLASDLNELRQTLMRRQADFDNYRKRIEKERAEDAKRHTARVIEGLIPIIDGFEHALAAHREAEYENYRKGFELIRRQLWEALAKQGLSRIESVGQEFNPHFHHAIESVETSEHSDGTVISEMQPGYLFHDRVLRPAMVRVASAPEKKSAHASKREN